MRVRSFGSRVLRWPDRDAVDAAVREWAADVAIRRSDIIRVGYFGSYARGDWGVGSDVDLAIVVRYTDEPFERRGLSFDVTSLPVPADVLVYTVDEWERLRVERGVVRTADTEMVWVFTR